MIICENCINQYNVKKRSIVFDEEGFSPGFSLYLHLCDLCWKKLQTEVKITISKFQFDKDKLKAAWN